MLRESKLLGVLYADSCATAGCFDRVDLEILSLFAEHAAGAIESSRLLADVQRSYAELKGVQERLIRGERLRVMGEMTSGVAHEFNNLLTAILARIQLLGLEYLAPEVREHLQLIERAALDAAGVVRRLQGFARASQRANFSANRIVFEVPSVKVAGIRAWPSQFDFELVLAAPPKTWKLPA